MKENLLWTEALNLANEYAFKEIETPEERLKEIGKELISIHDIEDIKALLRIARKAKGDI